MVRVQDVGFELRLRMESVRGSPVLSVSVPVPVPSNGLDSRITIHTSHITLP